MEFVPGKFEIISGGYDKVIKLWDPLTCKEIRIISGHTGSIKAMAVDRSG